MTETYSVLWVRTEGAYEAGARGSRWCPLPPEHWSVFRKYTNELRAKLMANRLLKRGDAHVTIATENDDGKDPGQ